jgi:hypothetical protein
MSSMHESSTSSPGQIDGLEDARLPSDFSVVGFGEGNW